MTERILIFALLYFIVSVFASLAFGRFIEAGDG